MKITVNQLGYTPEADKIAVICGGAPEQAQALDDAGRVVLTVPVRDAGELWGDRTATADFSALKTPGRYTLRCGDAVSHPFRVAEAPYAACLTALTDMFYLQRCGTALGPEAGDFAHGACHHTPATVYGTDERREVSGGWHDAGDYGRYVVAAARAVADLLLAWRWNPRALDAPGLTRLTDEARWELEWMLKMQREDGAVYHKVTCASFCGMELMPDDETEPLVISPVSTTATADFAACMALASRVYAAEDAAFASAMLSAARRACAWVDGQAPMCFRNPEGVVTGEYGDPAGDADERLWAHVELAVTTEEAAYAEAALAELRRADKDSALLGWEDMSGYAAIDGCALAGEAGEMCRAWVVRAAGKVADRVNAYGIALTEDFPWGSNMSVANDGMLLIAAYRLTGDAAFLRHARRQADYLMGVNPMDVCYVTGFGEAPVRHPHHRPSASRGYAMPGMLSGGPDSGLHDPCAAELLQGRQGAKCFVDDTRSYSTNEITIYWNSPLVALLTALTA